MILTILKLSAISILLSGWFTPINWIKNKIWKLKRPKWSYHLDCPRCISFWLAILLYQDVLLASLVAVTTYFVDFGIILTENYFK